MRTITGPAQDASRSFAASEPVQPAASGVRTEAPKGVKRTGYGERTMGESKPVREAVGSRRGD